MNTDKIALVGNPNVGKSTVFNALTGMHQHTGNWTGKTVSVAEGKFSYDGEEYTVIDLPGTYSLMARSAEEEVTRDYILQNPDCSIIVVCDACALERNLNLLLQVLEINKNVLVCVNLLDEAKRKGISIDLKKLSSLLDTAVIGCSASNGEGIDEIKKSIKSIRPCGCKFTYNRGLTDEEKIQSRLQKAQEISQAVVSVSNERKKRGEGIDKLLTGKLLAFPTMIIFLSLLLFITITLANYPSELLSRLFTQGEKWLHTLMLSANIPKFICDFVCLGVIRVVCWIVSVMLPPMAIFFPLFTLLEDWGYLPRIAFNLDRPFCKCGSCGKQALTMCMGIGCNAVGVTGCRIIDSPKERKIAILTNGLVPCNGRFPTLIMILTLFFAGSGALSSLKGALLLTLVLVCAVAFTLLISYILSKLLKGEKSTFILELPPYRKPKIAKTLVRSIFDRTVFVLLRALCVAVPAGAIIFLMSNIMIGNSSILIHVSNFLDPFGRVFGMDGIIILAFILGLPANEIVIPIALMTYTSKSTMTDITDMNLIGEILTQNGWNTVTALCVLIFTLFHSPCLTTLLTVKKETGSVKYTVLSAIIPTLLGLVLCFIVNLFFHII
ncbi:MAG: ferrous iron transporter B [Clostridia bacterium]|nr:ferrous iron transporter B [Clostridia bacterium]